MKNLILSAILILTLGLQAQSKNQIAKLDELVTKDAPSNAKKTYKKTKKGNFKVSFKQVDCKVILTYNDVFELQSIKRTFKGEFVPNIIVKYVQTEYTGFEIKKYVITSRPEKKTKYKVIITREEEKKKLAFDKDHNFLKEIIKKR